MKNVKTILLVDDEPEILTVIEIMLNDMGFNVISAQSGESALSILRSGAIIDLVITDYRMPRMDGAEFIAELRKFLPSLPVIMITASGGVELFIKALSLGVFEYINKPIVRNELERIVKAALFRTGYDNSLSIS